MRKKNLDSKKVNTKFVEIVFPIPTVRSFYYSVPDELQDQAKVGVRAVAPVGNRVTTGYIINTFEEIESFDKEIKPIEDIIDSIPFFDENYLRFAQWVADYYFASLGEVLEAAVPYGSDVESQKIVQVDPEYLFEEIKNSEVRRKNYIRLLQILSEKKEHTYKELQKKLKKENLYNKIWQAFAVLLPVQSVGVMGDARTYENVLALRAVTSVDGMTADWYNFEGKFLAKVSNLIINKVAGVNRVVYDISSKPPSTIEWE